MASTHDAALDDGRLRTRNALLREAVHRHKSVSRKGVQERLFTYAFSGLVYPQIWEDPAIDLEAMRLKDGERLVAIASGGCNVFSYLTGADVRITAVDLNPAHVAYNKLKRAAVEHLPGYTALHRFFADADSRANIAAYYAHLQPRLDWTTRSYWEGRDGIGRRRIGYFGHNVYHHGLLGLFIGAGHMLARVHGRDPRRLLSAKSQAEQREIFDSEIAPLFEMRHIRWLCEQPAALFGLGIPPSQFDELKGKEAHMATVLKARLERLACGFALKDNYFAWQAFGRRYATGPHAPLPPYLERQHYETLRQRAPAVDIRHASFTDFLASQPAASHDAYVLLDAQDWMTDEQLSAVWREIARTGRPGARVIFRTAGEETILPGRIPAEILSRFSYDAAACREMTARDRSSIYGGFHLYVMER